MSLSISGTLSLQPAAASVPAPAPTTQAPKTQPSDTAAVSQSAQVSQLSLQGESPSQIAESLGITISQVNSDLGFATAPALAFGQSA